MTAHSQAQKRLSYVQHFQTSRSLYILLPLLVALPLILKFFILNATIIGNDTQTHIYKTIILQRNIEQLPFFLWGKWDWNWYAGYPFLQVYSPLFYYFLAAISSFFDISPNLAARSILPLFFFISAFSMYALAMRLTRNKFASILASVTYVYSPYLIANLTIYGSAGSFIAFAFPPIALFYADKLINNGKEMDAFLSAVFTGLTLLSNQAIGLTSFVVVIAYLLLHKKVVATTKVVIETFLITAFWILPYVTYIQRSLLPVAIFRNPIGDLGSILSENLGFAAIALIAVALWLFGKKISKNSRVFKMCIILAFLTIYNVFSNFFPLPFFSAFALGRTMSAYVLLMPPIVATAFTLTDRISRSLLLIIATTFLALLVIEGLFIPVYTPLQVKTYVPAYNYLTTDHAWYRVFQVPQEPINSLIPLFSNKSVIGGWYDQGSPIAVLVHNISDNRDYSGKPMTPTLIADPQEAIALLAYLGVKFIIVDKADPIFGPAFSQALYDSIISTETVMKVFASGNTTIFRLEKFQPITLGTKVIAANNMTEFMNDILYRQKDEAIVYSGQESLLSTDSNGIANYTIFSINQTYQNMEYKFCVDRSALLILPLGYDKSLEASINGTQVAFFEVPPGVIGIPLKTAGTYVIDVGPTVTNMQLISLSISVTWIIGVLVINVSKCINRKWRSKHKLGENP
jgi:hypothetical protein